MYATQHNLVKATVRSSEVKFVGTKPKLLYGYLKTKQKAKVSSYRVSSES